MFKRYAKRMSVMAVAAGLVFLGAAHVHAEVVHGPSDMTIVGDDDTTGSKQTHADDFRNTGGITAIGGNAIFSGDGDASTGTINSTGQKALTVGTDKNVTNDGGTLTVRGGNVSVTNSNTSTTAPSYADGVSGHGIHVVGSNSSFGNTGHVRALGGSAFAEGATNSSQDQYAEAIAGSGLFIDGTAWNTGRMDAMGGLYQTAGTNGKTGGGYGLSFGELFTNRANGALALYSNNGVTNAIAAREAVYLTKGANFLAGSSLLLMGEKSGAAIAVADNQTVAFATGSRVISYAASTKALGGVADHGKIFVAAPGETITVNGINNFNGPIMKATATADGDGSIEYTTERVGYASRMTSGDVSRFMASLESALRNVEISEQNLPWLDLLTSVDYQATRSGVNSRANTLARKLAPVNTTQMMSSAMRGARLAEGVFSDNIQALGKGRTGGASATSSATVLGTANERLRIWTQPLYLNGKQKGKDDIYGSLDEEYYGASVGAAFDTGPVVISLSGHYLRGEYDASDFDADADAYGVTLGIGKRFAVAEQFNPWVELRAGYTKFEFDQSRDDVYGNSLDAKPDADVFHGGLTVNNDFTFGSFVVTPVIGVDFAHMDMESYNESGSYYALHVSPDDYTSCRGVAGLDLSWNPVDKFFIDLRGRYYYEFADKRASVSANARTLTALDFDTKGDDLSRHSGSVGAGVRFDAGPMFFGANYDLLLGDKYKGHQVMGTIGITF